MTATSHKIGLVGAGKMGLPIAMRLLAAGHTVTVLPSPRQTGRLAPELAEAGCLLAATGAELARRADILLTCLPTSADVEAVLTGSSGIFAGLDRRSDMLHIDHTSGDPETSRRLAIEWQARGGLFIDAAISGTPEMARTDGIRLLCGGSTDAIKRLNPITSAYCREIIHAGETGSGHMLRLIGGLMGYGMAMLASEAFMLCSAAGISAGSLRTMITGTGADSRTFQSVASTELDENSDSMRRHLSMATVAKDLDALAAQAARLECDVPVAQGVAGRMAEAANQGDPEALISDLSQKLKTLADMKARG